MRKEVEVLEHHPHLGAHRVDVLRVSVDRSGLDQGAHTGSIEVQSNGGTLTVNVLMLVPSPQPPPPPDVDIHILALDAQTQELVQEVVVNPASHLDFNFAALPVGDYVLLASTDLDRDGVVCEDGEYCGAYPVLSDPVVVSIFQGLTWTGANFAVDKLTGVGDLATRGGVRLPAGR